jgi:hypothetical protein
MVEAALAACVHVWEIELANGHTSPGTCRRCGETREFANSSEHLVVSTGRPLDFHPRPAAPIEEETVKKVNMHQRHQEIEKRWPEIKKTIEELGGLNRAAKQLGLSYEGTRRAAARHGFDVKPYLTKAGRRPAPVRETDGQAFRDKPAANGHDNIGEALIGMGLVMIGAWLETRKGG